MGEVAVPSDDDDEEENKVNKQQKSVAKARAERVEEGEETLRSDEEMKRDFEAIFIFSLIEIFHVDLLYYC